MLPVWSKSPRIRAKKGLDKRGFSSILLGLLMDFGSITETIQRAYTSSHGHLFLAMFSLLSFRNNSKSSNAVDRSQSMTNKDLKKVSAKTNKK